MPKFYRKKYFRGNRDKYSIEHTSVSVQTGAVATANLYQQTTNIVPASPTQGMRKVKHVTVSLTSGVPQAGSLASIYWALVYVPEGYSVNTLNGNPGASFYEPNQFVMAAGCNDPEAGPIRVRSPIARNLNSGDSIWLVVGTDTPSVMVKGLVNFAITLQ